MKMLKRMQEKMTQWENTPRMARLLRLIDQTVQIVGNRRYKGSNPALASVYAPMRASIIIMLAITIITLVFGALVPVESAAIAKGSVVVLSKRKTVQHLEGGIVKRILVEDGDVVKKDQPLMEISDVAPKANKEIVHSELLTERASEARLLALQTGAATFDFPPEMKEASTKDPALAKTMQTQMELFTTQHDAQMGKLQTLNQRIAQSQEEIGGLRAQIGSAEGQLALINEEAKSVQDLLKEGLATKPRLLALQRQAEELKGTRGQNIALIAKAEQSINETKMDIINQQNDFSTHQAEELRDVRDKISDYDEKLRAATDVMDRTVILSPSEGIVTGLKFHTVGGVVAAGAPIMDIVPQSDQLVLEVRIKPGDIDVVKPGLESRVVFSAYKARRMPLFTGKVTQVSADAFTEQQGAQSVSYYTARVTVDGQQLSGLETPINLYPGMPAEVYIRTGSRSFLTYLFAPLTDSMGRAFTEE